MTGRGQPVSNVLQKARQRLLRLGLTDDHILTLPTAANETFDGSHLDPLQADPNFSAIVQRVVRFLRGGRGLSIAIADDGRRGDARVHTAVQLAAGLTRHGIHVVVVDMDLQHPGLNGLIPDPQSEGLIDMVRFGRSCRSVLQKPLDSGPSLLSAGSFPVQGPLPLDEDAIRSVLHRVSLHCELALYVAPLLPDANVLNPVVRLCEHVVLVQSVSEDSVDVVERIQLMQQARLHVAGVVLFESSRAGTPEPQKWQPGSLYQEPSPGTVPPGVAPTAAGAVQPDAAATPPSATAPPASPPPAFPEPVAPGAEVPAKTPMPEPPTVETPVPPAASAPVDAPIPHIAWKGRRPQALTSAPEEAEIPEIHLPDETEPAGPFSSPPQPFASATDAEQVEGTHTPEASAGRPTGAEAIERLWAEPEQPASEEPLAEATSSVPLSTAGQETFIEHPVPHAPGAGAFARDETEKVDFRMTDFAPPDYEDAETEFAYDDGNNWSRTPLYILVTLLVLVAGFFGWALWTKRGIEQQVGQQLLDTDWIDAPKSAEGSGVPDDAAAVPRDDAGLPTGGLKGVGGTREEKTTQSPPSGRPVSPAGKDATEERAPIRVPEEARQVPGGVAERTPGSTTGGSTSGKPPATTPPSATPGAMTDANYTVHVGSFRHLEQAYKEIAALQKRGFTSRAVRTDLGSKGNWYRVYVGGFATRSEAEVVRDRILELPEYRYAQVKRLP